MLSYRRIYLIGCYLLWEKLHQKFLFNPPMPQFLAYSKRDEAWTGNGILMCIIHRYNAFEMLKDSFKDIYKIDVYQVLFLHPLDFNNFWRVVYALKGCYINAVSVFIIELMYRNDISIYRSTCLIDI